MGLIDLGAITGLYFYMAQLFLNNFYNWLGKNSPFFRMRHACVSYLPTYSCPPNPFFHYFYKRKTIIGYEKKKPSPVANFFLSGWPLFMLCHSWHIALMDFCFILTMDFICELLSFCGSNIAQNNLFSFSSEKGRELGKDYSSISNLPRKSSNLFLNCATKRLQCHNKRA